MLMLSDNSKLSVQIIFMLIFNTAVQCHELYYFIITAYCKRVVIVTILVFSVLLSSAGLGLFIGYSSQTPLAVNTTYFNDSYTAPPLCYNSFDVNRLEITTSESFGFSADVYLVPESDIVYNYSYVLPEVKLDVTSFIDISICNIRFHYPSVEYLFSNTQPGTVHYRLQDLRVQSGDSCGVKLFLFDSDAAYESFNDNCNDPKGNHDSVASSDCINTIGTHDVNFTLSPNKAFRIIAYTDPYKNLQVYMSAELTRVNVSRLTPICTVTSSNPCNVRLSDIPIRNFRKCVLLKGSGAGSVTVTDVPVSWNGVKITGVVALGVFGLIFVALGLPVVILCVKYYCSYRRHYTVFPLNSSVQFS